MKRLAVLSGKGGTGKTTVTSSLAQLLAPVVVVDCDVDAANLALLLPGEDEQAFAVTSGNNVHVDPDACNGCEVCLQECRFGAIHMSEGKAVIFSLLCEGCNTCFIACKEKAIVQTPRTAGAAWIRSTSVGPLVHAELAVAQDNSGHLVSYIRDLAEVAAKKKMPSWVLLDGPPGLGCPVQATLAGVDRVLIVTECSKSGIADLERLLALLARLKLQAAVIVNKWDLATDASQSLVQLCEQNKVTILGKIPFDPEVPRCLARGQIPINELVSIQKGLSKVPAWLAHCS